MCTCSVTDFVLTHAQAAAQRTIETEALLVLSERDTTAFLSAMHSSWQPSQAVRDDIRAMQTLLGEGQDERT